VQAAGGVDAAGRGPLPLENGAGVGMGAPAGVPHRRPAGVQAVGQLRLALLVLGGHLGHPAGGTEEVLAVGQAQRKGVGRRKGSGRREVPGLGGREELDEAGADRAEGLPALLRQARPFPKAPAPEPQADKALPSCTTGAGQSRPRLKLLQAAAARCWHAAELVGEPRA